MSKLLLVLVVGLVAGLGAINGEITIGGPEDFLNQRQTNKQNTDDVRQALLALNIPDGVELTADVIEEAFVKAGQDEKIRFGLLDLGSYGYCRDYTIDSLIAIFREKELEQFKSFFEKHWFEKIQQCAEVARRDMINDYETNEFVYSLEDFIKTAVPVERGVSDEDYYEILKGVDLNNLERYNTPAVKAIVSNDRTSNRNRRGKNVSAGDVNKYIKFVTKKCSHFINLQDEFIISNLAQRYENAPEVPDQLTLDIYGELNRICMSWLNGGDKERKELMKNSIKEQQEAAYFIPISRRR